MISTTTLIPRATSRLLGNKVVATTTCKLCKRLVTTANVPVLEKVGNFTLPIEPERQYETGQTFLHRVFAYRGVILHPWHATIYERNRDTTNNTLGVDSKKTTASSSKTETYYQVLMDMRDSPHVAAHSEAVTFLHSMNAGLNQSLYTIPGLDYVSHDDILPYTPADVQPPIKHDLYERFLHYDQATGTTVPSDMLQTWQTTHHHCLQLGKVHKETTENIRVTAIPFYLGVKTNQNNTDAPSEFWWRYCIRIENLGKIPARLRERHWRIISNGSVKTVRGRGITGKEPLLDAETPVFQYSSHISLLSSSGHVWGTYRFEKENGEQFDARIPAFALESKPMTDQD